MKAVSEDILKLSTSNNNNNNNNNDKDSVITNTLQVSGINVKDAIIGGRHISNKLSFKNKLKQNNSFIRNIESAVVVQEEEELLEQIEEYKRKEEAEKLKRNNKREYILSLFSRPLFAELFFAWSRDCEDNISVENAKYFRDELIMRGNKDDKNFNFRGMRVTKNFLVAFTGNVTSTIINRLDLSDNLITDICLHNIKSLISNKRLVHLNLASNMISTEGLKIIHSEIIYSDSLSYLNLGISEGSFRRNNFSGDGGLILARILLTNESLKTIVLQDNDLGEDSGDKIGTSLIQNKNLQKLKIAENKIKNKGARTIIENADKLHSLDLSNNEISSDICFDIRKLLKQSRHLQELVWDSNNVGLKGIKLILEGVQSSTSLKKLSIKNINIGDTGIKLIAEGLFNNMTLEELDISSNSVTIEGFIPLCDSILTNKIKVLKSRNNLLGDDSMRYFASTVLSSEEDKDDDSINTMNNSSFRGNSDVNETIFKKANDTKIKNKTQLEYFDFSSSKIYDQGLIYLLHQLQHNISVTKVKLRDNYFTHEVDLLLIEYLDKNYSLTKFDIEKNRLSLLCVSKVNEIIERNRKQQSEKEPNRLLVEVYRLRYENTKLDEMKDSLRYLENNVEKVKLNRADLRQEFDTFKRGIDEEYEGLKRRLEKHSQSYQKSTIDCSVLEKELETTKAYNEKQIEEVNEKQSILITKKEEMQKMLEDLKLQFNEEESQFISNYDRIRSEAQEFNNKIKKIDEEHQEVLALLSKARRKVQSKNIKVDKI